MKKLNAFLVFILVISDSVLAASKRMMLCVRNRSDQPHTLAITDINNAHWERKSRPDMNFNGQRIGPGETLCNGAYINTNTKPAFTFLVDGDPTNMELLGRQNDRHHQERRRVYNGDIFSIY